MKKKLITLFCVLSIFTASVAQAGPWDHPGDPWGPHPKDHRDNVWHSGDWVAVGLLVGLFTFVGISTYRSNKNKSNDTASVVLPSTTSSKTASTASSGSSGTKTASTSSVKTKSGSTITIKQ